MRWTVIGFLLLTFAAGCSCQTMSPEGSMSTLMSSSIFPYASGPTDWVTGSWDDWTTSADWTKVQIGTEPSNWDFPAGLSQSDFINPTQSDSGFAPTDTSWYSSGLEENDWSNSGIIYGSMSDEWSASTYSDGMYRSMAEGWTTESGPTGSVSDGMYGSMPEGLTTESWPTGSLSDGMSGSMPEGWTTESWPGSVSDGTYGSMPEGWTTGSLSDGMSGSMPEGWTTGSWPTGSLSDGMFGSMPEGWTTGNWPTGSLSDGMSGSMPEGWTTGSWPTGSVSDGMFGSMPEGWTTGNWPTGSVSDGMSGSMPEGWTTGSVSDGMSGSMPEGWTTGSWPTGSVSDSMSVSMPEGWTTGSVSEGMFGSMPEGWTTGSWPTGSVSDSMSVSMPEGWTTGSVSEGMFGSMPDGWTTGSWPTGSLSDGMFGSMPEGWTTGIWPPGSLSDGMYGSMSSGLPSSSYSGSMWPTSGYSGSLSAPNQTWYPTGSMYPSSTWGNNLTGLAPNQTWYPTDSMYPSSTWGNNFSELAPNQTWYPTGSIYPSSTWGNNLSGIAPNQTWYPTGSMYPSSTWGNNLSGLAQNQTWYPTGSMYPSSTWGNNLSGLAPNQTWYPSGSILPSSSWGNSFTGPSPSQTMYPSGSILPSGSWSNSFTEPSQSQSKSPSGSILPSTWQLSGSSKPAISPTGVLGSSSQSWMISPSMDRSSSISGSWHQTMKSSDFTTSSPTSTSTIGVTCNYDADCPPSFLCNSNPYTKNQYSNRTGQNSTYFDYYDYYYGYGNNSNYGGNMNHSGPSICDLETPIHPNFTARVMAKSSTEHVIALYCKFHTESNLKYKITWRADHEAIYTSSILTDTQAASHYVTAQNLSVNGFALEKSFYCEVSVYVFDFVSSKHTQMAGPYYSYRITPVEVYSTFILMQRGGDADIMVRINIPFPCAPGKNCTLDFKFYDPEESHGCGNSTIAFKNRYTCGERIMGTAQLGEAQRIGDKRIIVTTKNNAKYNLKSYFNLVMKAEVSGTGVETWWAGTFSRQLTVYVTDYAHYWKGNYCYSNNDPRLRTLDGYYYSLQKEGEFIMMRHKELPVQVNLLTESCNWGFGTCSCGVIVRAGKDVYTVNHCSGEHMSAYSSLDHDDDDTVVGVAKKRVLFARERSSNRWQVYLPHGTVVDISVSSRSWFSWTLVNVQIIPSPSDMEKLEGLCGNFNGDYTDDLTHSDGTVTATSSYYCWWNCVDPNDFSTSWEVQDADSLLNPDNQAKLSSWDYDNYLCVCTGNNGEGEATCSANEEASCKHIDRVGDVDDYKIRSRRSAESRERRERREDFMREIEKSRFDRDINRRLMDTLQKRQSAEKRKKRSVSPQTVSESQAMELCQRNMDNSCGVLINNTEDRVNITNRLRNCAQDTMLHNETNWGPCTCEGAKKEAEVLVTADETVNNTFIKAVEEFCNNNCNSNGTCSKGKCSCNSNYAFDDCSLDKRSKVKISSITGNGMCNKGSSSCSQILLVTDGVVSGSKCSVRHYEIDINGTVTDMGEQQVNAVYVNAYEMYCPVPTTSRRRRRSTSSGGSNVANSYTMSVSNDGNTFSDASAVVVLDSTCLTYTNSTGTISITLNASYCLIDGTCYANGENQTGSTCNYCDVSSDSFDWTLMSGYCLIDSTCYTNGTAKTGDSCNYCNATLDTTAWTFDNITESCLKTDKDAGLEGYIIAIIVICSLLGVAGLVAAVYVIRQKYLASKERKVGLFDSQPHSKFTIRVEPNSKETSHLSNKLPLPKIFAEPKPGTEGVPDNLYTDREMLSRSDTVVPAMPWGESPNTKTPKTSTIQVESQKTETSFGLAPPAPWTKPAPGEVSPHTSTIQIGNQEAERPRSRASVSPAPSSHEHEIPIENKDFERISL